jgi:hypothetical protein
LISTYDPGLGKENDMKRAVISAVLGMGMAMLLASGCTPLDVLKNQGDICQIVNCAELSLVVPGPHNYLVPDHPDYSNDPTCTLAGYCGPNIYYPEGVPPADYPGITPTSTGQ